MPHRFLIKKLKRFLIYRVLHVDDTPHRIALGLAIGIFITWTPLIGLQMILAVALAALARANKFVGIPFVWISNPLTAVPLYGFNFLVGAWVLPGEYSVTKFVESASKALSFSGSWMDRIGAWWSAMWEFFWPLWVGSILVGLALGVVTYFVTRRAIVLYRRRLHRHDPAAPAPNAMPAPASEPDPQPVSASASAEAKH